MAKGGAWAPSAPPRLRLCLPLYVYTIGSVDG